MGPPNTTVTLHLSYGDVTVRLGPDGQPAPGEMIESVPGPLGHGWFAWPGSFRRRRKAKLQRWTVTKLTQERPLGSPNSTVTIKVGQHNVDVRLGPDGMPAPGEMIFSVPGPFEHGWFPPGMFSWLRF